MTIVKSKTSRSKGSNSETSLDARTQRILREVLSEGRGRSLDAYLRVFGSAKKNSR